MQRDTQSSQQPAGTKSRREFLKLSGTLTAGAALAGVAMPHVHAAEDNTIRLALYSQRLLIRSMQLVGATNGFIQLPFLRRGMTQGLMSGIVAAALLFILLQVALRNIDGLATLQEPEKIAILLGAVVVLGVIIGLISTFQAV
nr:twin-arginine translocation signal domain-containing protein [Candidatus Anammoximicrobium sp.]